MGRYLDLIAEVKRRQSAGEGGAKKTKERKKSGTPSLAQLIAHQPHTPEDHALRHLWRLTAEHRATLAAGGYDPSGARVALIRWREATSLDPFAFHEVLRRLVDQGRVEHSDHYVRPMGGPT
jgi:hypothetical protein